MFSPPRAPTFCLLLLAVISLSTAVLFIQLSVFPPVGLTAWRLLFAGALLAPLAHREWRQHRANQREIRLGLTVLPGLVFALHLVTWVIGARRTPTANASLIVNMAPLVLPGLLYLLARERVSRREWIGTGIVLLGLIVLVGGDLHLSASTAQGDLLCFGSMLFLALYLALARQRSPQIPGFALYVAPLYLVGSGACFLCLPLAGEPLLPEPSQWKWALALAVVPTVVGHSLLNHSMKRLRGQVVAVASQTQFVFAGAAAYGLFGAVPALTFYPACLLALAGAAYILRKDSPGPAETP